MKRSKDRPVKLFPSNFPRAIVDLSENAVKNQRCEKYRSVSDRLNEAHDTMAVARHAAGINIPRVA